MSTSDIERDECTPLLSSGHVASAGHTPSDGIKEPEAIRAEAVRDVELDTHTESAVVGRNLSWSSAFILVISRVIGSGIFATPGAILTAAGSPGLALSIWLCGTVLAACGMAVNLEFGMMLPRSGGEKVYLEFVYRYPRFLASTLVAVQAVLLGFTASNAIVFAEYLLFAIDVEPQQWTRKAVAVALLTTITLVHGCFLRTGIRIQNFLGWIKITLVIFMIITGFVVVILGSGGRHADAQLVTERERWHDGVWDGSKWDWGLLATAVFKVVYSFAGLNNANNVMNEVKNPQKTLRSVTLSALVTTGFLYLLINVAYFVVVPLDEIKSSGQLVAALFFERTLGSSVGKILLPLGIALSAAGNVMVVTFSLSRVNQEVARQGFLPFADWIASSKPFNAPLGALIVHYIPSLLVIVLPPPGDVYNFIIDVEVYAGTIFSLILVAGLIILRYRRPDLKRPFKAWSLAVVMRVLVSLALIAAPFFPPQDGKGDVSIWYATYAVVAASILLFGVLYWYIWTVLLPRLGGYRLEEAVNVLDDGTSITRLVRVKND